jgi:hypothetical protein
MARNQLLRSNTNIFGEGTSRSSAQRRPEVTESLSPDCPYCRSPSTAWGLHDVEFNHRMEYPFLILIEASRVRSF